MSYLHLEGLPPQISQLLNPEEFKPPQLPEIGFLPKITPTDIARITQHKKAKVIRKVVINKF